MLRESLSRYFWKLLLLTSRTTNLFRKVVIRKWETPLEQQMSERLFHLLSFVNLSVPFCKNIYTKFLVSRHDSSFSLEELPLLPIITKQSLKIAGKDALANDYLSNFQSLYFNLDDSFFRNLYKILFQKDFIFEIQTGGTTGSPLTSYKNKTALLTDGLLFLRGWLMMGWKPGSKVLWFYNSYYDNNFSFANALAFLTGIKLFFFDHLSDETILRFVNEYNAYKPDIVVTFPSYINDAASTIEKNGYKLMHFPLGIEVSGESLFSHQRRNIENVFKAKVFDSYGANEFGMVAHECEYQNGMHVYEDMALLESIEHGGDTNSLLVTRYDSIYSPAIRYKVGDRGTLARHSCPCGRTGLVLQEVDGRVDDFIELPDKKRMYPSTFRQILSKCDKIFDNCILESNLVQTATHSLTFQVVLSSKSEESKITDWLVDNFRQILPRDVNINLNIVDSIRGRKKFRFIERNISSVAIEKVAEKTFPSAISQRIFEKVLK